MLHLSLSPTLCYFEIPGSFANLFLLFLRNKRHGRKQTELLILLYAKNEYSINQQKLRGLRKSLN